MSDKAHSASAMSVRSQTRLHLAKLREERLQRRRRARIQPSEPLETTHFTAETMCEALEPALEAMDTPGELHSVVSDAAMDAPGVDCEAAAGEIAETLLPEADEMEQEALLEAPGDTPEPEMETSGSEADLEINALTEATEEGVDTAPTDAVTNDEGVELPAADPEAQSPEAETIAESDDFEFTDTPGDKPVGQVPSDLAELPGAGPGLIWLFEKCGVTSLRDLARADPDTLRKDLGLVAEILDVDYWIEFAAMKK